MGSDEKSTRLPLGSPMRGSPPSALARKIPLITYFQGCAISPARKGSIECIRLIKAIWISAHPRNDAICYPASAPFEFEIGIGLGHEPIDPSHWIFAAHAAAFEFLGFRPSPISFASLLRVSEYSGATIG